MFKIALAQTNVHPGNPRQNTAVMKECIAKAKAAGCDLIVFPELAIPGYLIGDIWDQPDYIDDCVRFGEEIKALSDGMAIIFGNVAKETDRVNLDGRTRKYNAMFIAYNGRWISPARSPYPFYIKTLLPNYREFSDIRYFTSLIEVAQERHAFPEDFLSPVQIPFDDGRKFRMGPLICEDSWDENYPFKPMSYLGKMYDIDMFINISNSPFTLGKTQRRHRLFGQAIDKVHCPAIYVNCTGIQNNGKNIYTFDGASSTYQKDGSQHVECTPFTEEMVIVDFDEKAQRFVSPSHLQPEKSPIEDIYASLHYGLKSFMDAIGVHKVVLGVSGGIDSAVNAALYATVLPPKNILLVNMPSCYNSDMTKSLAKELADNIGCLYTVVPVQDSLELTRHQFEGAGLSQKGQDKGHLELTSFIEENIQARDRSSVSWPQRRQPLAASSRAMPTRPNCPSATPPSTATAPATWRLRRTCGSIRSTTWPAISMTRSFSAKSCPRVASTSSPAPNCRTSRISPRARATRSSTPITTTSSPPSSNAGNGHAGNHPRMVHQRHLGKEHRLQRGCPSALPDGKSLHRRPGTVVAPHRRLRRRQAHPEPAYPLHQPPPLRQRPARSPAGTVLHDALPGNERTAAGERLGISGSWIGVRS